MIVGVVLVFQLAFGHDDVDGLGVEGERGEDVHQRGQSQARRLVHQQRVLVRDLLDVRRQRRAVKVDEAQLRQLLLVPHCRRNKSVNG